MSTVPQQVNEVAHLFFIDERVAPNVFGTGRNEAEAAWKAANSDTVDRYRAMAYQHVRAFNLLRELEAQG